MVPRPVTKASVASLPAAATAHSSSSNSGEGSKAQVATNAVYCLSARYHHHHTALSIIHNQQEKL